MVKQNTKKPKKTIETIETQLGTKQLAKKEKQEQDKTEKSPKEVQSKNNKTSDKVKKINYNPEEIPLFSEDFNRHINKFQTFYYDYLQIRTNKDGGESSTEFKQLSDEVRKQIEKNSVKVLMNELSNSEDWIHREQQAIKKNILKVEEEQEKSRKSLESINSFSAADIQVHQELFKTKKAEFQNKHNELQSIRMKITDISKSSEHERETTKSKEMQIENNQPQNPYSSEQKDQKLVQKMDEERDEEKHQKSGNKMQQEKDQDEEKNEEKNQDKDSDKDLEKDSDKDLDM